MTTIDDFFSPEKLEHILFTYLKTESREAIDAVRNIISHNATSGRLERRIKKDAALTLELYVDIVFGYYKAHWVDAEALYNRNNQAWIELLHIIRRAVKSRLSTLGIQITNGGSGWTEDIIQTVAIELFQSAYPYDVDLTAWILRLTQNTTNRFFRDVIRIKKEFDVEDFEHLDIENRLFRRDDWIEKLELRLDVAQVIEQLSTDHRKLFAHLRYQRGLGYDEIAALMGRTKNTLYKLRSDTDKELRKIFRSEWYN